MVNVAIFTIALAFVLMMCRTAHAGTDYGDEICELITSYLDGDNWHYTFNEDDRTYNFNISISGKLQHLRYVVLVRGNGYTVYAISPINADKEEPSTMLKMADFVCRANYGVRNGNFELDMNDGELRYKVFVDCDECLPSQGVIRNSIMIPSVMFERYSPGILDVIFKDADVEDAIAKCER